MLADFILANKLKARIEERLIRHQNGTKCELYFAGTAPVLLIHLVHTHLDLKKVSKLLHKKNLTEASPSEVEDYTGYKKEYLPLVSIYGMQVVLDPQILEKDLLFTFIGEAKTLIISSSEVKEFNENALVADITEER